MCPSLFNIFLLQGSLITELYPTYMYTPIRQQFGTFYATAEDFSVTPGIGLYSLVTIRDYTIKEFTESRISLYF